MRVLLVEDEVRLAENVAAALRDGPGFAVDHAEDGVTAIDLAGNRCYDLVVLDLNLPLVDGPTVLRRLRASGDTTAKSVTVPLIGRPAYTGNKSFYLTLSNADGATAGAPAVATMFAGVPPPLLALPTI